MNKNQDILYSLRQAVGLSTTEAGQLVHVTRRTWEMWESGHRQIPQAKLELFLSKLSGERPSIRDLIVIFHYDAGFISPLDAVTEDIFLSISDVSDGKAIIKSMKVDRITGRPYVNSTRFCIEHNAHVMRKTKQWKSVLSD